MAPPVFQKLGHSSKDKQTVPTLPGSRYQKKSARYNVETVWVSFEQCPNPWQTGGATGYCPKKIARAVCWRTIPRRTVRRRQSNSTYVHINLNNSFVTLGALKPDITSWVALGIQALKTPEMRLTIKNAFANDGLFSVIRDPVELLEMQITATLKLMVPEIVIPTEAEDSDHDEELTFADLTAGDSGSDSDSD